jgi:hypothetical protein
MVARCVRPAYRSYVVQQLADPKIALLAATLNALRPGERIVWTHWAEPEDFRREILARGRWWRAARILFCAPAAAAFWYGATRHLPLYSRAEPLVSILWPCGLLAVVLYCGATVILAVAEVIAWSARARRAVYVVTDRRLLLALSGSPVRPLLSYVGEKFGSTLSEPPGDNVSLGATDRRSHVIVRTIDGIIGVAPCSGGRKVILFHHDSSGEDGHWNHRTTTLPGVRDPIALCEHVTWTRSLGRVPCPRGAESGHAPECPCITWWRAEYRNTVFWS